MTKFEVVLLFNPELTNQIIKTEIDNFKKQITSNSGKIINEEDWGLRDLSYNIKKFKKAFYNFIQIETSGDVLNGIKTEFNQSDNVIRHLFIKVKEHQELPTKLISNEKK